MELTDAIKDYVNKRVSSFEKLINKENSSVYVEVGKTTNHHNKGEVFKAEFEVANNGVKFFSQAEREDLYTAIDEAKEGIVRELTKNKDKKMTLYKRGATSVKKMLKGFTKRNPFTSKY